MKQVTAVDRIERELDKGRTEEWGNSITCSPATKNSVPEFTQKRNEQ